MAKNLPTAKEIQRACEAAGQPRSISAIRQWARGYYVAPVWLPVAIEATCEGFEAGAVAWELSTRLHKRGRMTIPGLATRRARLKQRRTHMAPGDIYTTGTGQRTHVIRKVHSTGRHDTGCDWSSGTTYCGQASDTTCVPSSQLVCRLEDRPKHEDYGRPTCKSCLRLEPPLCPRCLGPHLHTDRCGCYQLRSDSC